MRVAEISEWSARRGPRWKSAIGYADVLLAKTAALAGVKFAAMSQGGFGPTSQVPGSVPCDNESQFEFAGRVIVRF
jgi:hypothetical protein